MKGCYENSRTRTEPLTRPPPANKMLSGVLFSALWALQSKNGLAPATILPAAILAPASAAIFRRIPFKPFFFDFGGCGGPSWLAKWNMMVV